jgi:hypothetical protein
MTDTGEKIFSTVLMLGAFAFCFFFTRWYTGWKMEDDPVFTLLSLALAVGELLLLWLRKPKQNRQ